MSKFTWPNVIDKMSCHFFSEDWVLDNDKISLCISEITWMWAQTMTYELKAC